MPNIHRLCCRSNKTQDEQDHLDNCYLEHYLVVFNGRYNCFFVLFCFFFMRVCSKSDVFVCKARFCPFQPEEACSDKGAEKGNKLTLEQVTQMFGPSTYWYCGLFLIKRSLDSRIRLLIKVTSFGANHIKTFPA